MISSIGRETALLEDAVDNEAGDDHAETVGRRQRKPSGACTIRQSVAMAAISLMTHITHMTAWETGRDTSARLRPATTAVCR